jgi:hypothetical protein
MQKGMTALKIGKLLLLGVVFAVMLAGCSERGAATDKETPPPDTVAQAVLDSVTFRDSLIKAEGDVAANYYKLDDTIIEHAIYISGSGATAEEIAILKVADQEDLENAKAILEKRIENLKLQFESYVPGEMVKLENPVILTEGDLAILVLADDQAAAETAVAEALA